MFRPNLHTTHCATYVFSHCGWGASWRNVVPTCPLQLRTSSHLAPPCSHTMSAGMRQQVYLHHSHRPGYKVVARSPSYIDDMSRAQFCLAPTGGGHGKRQVRAVHAVQQAPLLTLRMAGRL